jgi:hypothetical protein
MIPCSDGGLPLNNVACTEQVTAGNVGFIGNIRPRLAKPDKFGVNARSWT